MHSDRKLNYCNPCWRRRLRNIDIRTALTVTLFLLLVGVFIGRASACEVVRVNARLLEDGQNYMYRAYRKSHCTRDVEDANYFYCAVEPRDEAIAATV